MRADILDIEISGLQVEFIEIEKALVLAHMELKAIPKDVPDRAAVKLLTDLIVKRIKGLIADQMRVSALLAEKNLEAKKLREDAEKA